MANVEATVDLAELDQALADVEQRGRRMGPAFRELRKPLRTDLRMIARQQTGPSQPWAPRSPLTESRRVPRNRRARTSKAMRTIALKTFRRRTTPKKILGRLPAAFAVLAGALYVRARWRVDWADAHRSGRRVGHGVKLPKRDFAWLSNQIIDKARAVFAKHIVAGWKR